MEGEHNVFSCGGFQRGQRPHLAHDFAKQSVVCYTLCRRCRENAVAAGEGKGIRSGRKTADWAYMKAPVFRPTL